MSALTPDRIMSDLTGRFDGLVPTQSWGETALFYNPGHARPRGVYFATIKDKDGANDQASCLNRSGVFRLNLGLPTDLYASLFGPRPARPAKGGAIEGDWDFTQLDVLMPHPVYGWMGWVCILTPSQARYDALEPYLRSAHAKAKSAFERSR